MTFVACDCGNDIFVRYKKVECVCIGCYALYLLSLSPEHTNNVWTFTKTKVVLNQTQRRYYKKQSTIRMIGSVKQKPPSTLDTIL